MALYVTIAQLQNSLKGTTYNDLTDSDSARQDANIDLAEGEVNSFTAAVMGVPTAAQLAADAPLAQWLRAATTAIAIHHAYSAKGPVPDEQVNRYEKWIAILEAVRDEMAIPPSANGLPDPTATVDEERTGDDRVFTESSVKGLW